MPEERVTTPAEQVARLYEQAETEAAKAGERVVGSRGFAGLLGQMAENAAAVSKLGNDAMDLVLRNLRLAGRRDVVRLARLLARNEDKLERVLQELEAVQDELRRMQERAAGSGRGSASSATPRRSSSGSRSTSRNGAPAKSRRRASS